MNYRQFKTKYQDIPIIDSHSVVRLSNQDPQVVRNQLNRWTQAGYLTPLCKGMYVFSEAERTNTLDEFYLANKMYEPSYISLETALSFYGIIPERATVITSISTLKTNSFHNPIGHFEYRHVKPACFRGFKNFKRVGHLYLMAEPEKAVIDFLYLNLSRFDKNISKQLIESYRFQEMENLNTDRMIEMAALFSSKKLMRVTKECTKLISEA